MPQPYATFSAQNSAGGVLERPLQFVKGIGPVRAKLLERLQLRTMQDALFHFPIGHKDRASITPIRMLKVGSEANIVARIVDVRGRRFSGREKVEALLTDDSGDVRAGWWNPYVADRLTPNAWGFFSGKLAMPNERREFSNAEFEIIDSDDDERAEAGAPSLSSSPNFGRIVPIYNLRPKQRLPDGEEAPEIRITQSALRKIVWSGLEAGATDPLRDDLPGSILKKLNLLPLSTAIRQFHFPDSFSRAESARRRLAFEELLIISIGVALRRAQIEKLAAAKRMPLVPAIQKRIEARLPFALTPSQQKSFDEIAADMAGTRPMNRLLQGDVGSGKTLVAVSAMLLCVAHSGQTALLAPTEVLAEQHARTLRTLLKDSRVSVGLLRGGMKAAERATFLTQLDNGEIQIAVGTHALLESDVKFKSLALVVVDEQHKFGVEQRMNLRAKGNAPHVLVMTATPIPRTITLTLYGDLDVSVISEPPPGRGEIVTKWVKEADRAAVYRAVVSEAKKGNAAYIVLPRIDSDQGSGSGVQGSGTGQQKLWNEVKGVEAEFKHLKQHLPTLRIGMLHGRMESSEKEDVIRRLREGKLDALVSTQVVEVGIDLQTATIMVIENAERFGLSALHQLRGRVGRSERKSFCFVFGEANTDDAKERLKTFVKTRDGFEIAETDFKLRGPGQFFGTNQSGMPELRIADLFQDQEILALARDEAFELVKRDPALKSAENAALRKRVKEVLGDRLGLIDIA